MVFSLILVFSTLKLGTCSPFPLELCGMPFSRSPFPDGSPKCNSVECNRGSRESRFHRGLEDKGTDLPAQFGSGGSFAQLFLEVMRANQGSDTHASAP